MGSRPSGRVLRKTTKNLSKSGANYAKDEDDFMLSLLNAYKTYDPAARSRIEIFFLYPGFRATMIHRFAHHLYENRIPFIPRFLSELSRWMNAMDIHPGAVIGKNVVIDHGLGIVIGETSIIGDSCILYQGVTLGGTSLTHGKRHPTLEANVVVGAGAKVLGNIVIGTRSRVGANSVVIRDVPPLSTVVGVPGVLVSRGIQPNQELNHDYII
jgi:serine O-acetyltransferase